MIARTIATFTRDDVDPSLRLMRAASERIPPSPLLSARRMKPR